MPSAVEICRIAHLWHANCGLNHCQQLNTYNLLFFNNLISGINRNCYPTNLKERNGRLSVRPYSSLSRARIEAERASAFFAAASSPRR